GWPDLAYFRLHGSPRKYWSRYDEDYIAALAETVRRTPSADVWCLFDNTASGAAIDNACDLRAMAGTSSNIGQEESMPFKSQAQRRKFAQLLVEGKISDKTFEEWNRETGSKKLPERTKPRRRKAAAK